MEIRPGCLSILMPVYNERAYLRKCVQRVMAVELPYGLTREIIMVDDASTDGTQSLVEALAKQYPDVIRPFYQKTNQGKGAAIARAVEEMVGSIAIVQDADLEYDPNDYASLLKPIMEHGADVVYGSRFATRSMRRVMNYRHELGNRFLTLLSNLTTGLNLTDMETCYKVFKADLLKSIPLRSKRFGIEPEITAKIAKRNAVVYEVPINYYGRGYAEGKKIGWKDGVSALYTILKYTILDDCFDNRYGHAVLETISGARRFNQWMTAVIEPYLGSRILEIGSGIGNISRQLPLREKLIVSDYDKTYLNVLENTFMGNELVKVAKVDLTCDDDFKPLVDDAVDSIVCMNVLEHIEDDVSALKRMNSVLPVGGKLVLLVPQYEALYGSFDEQLDHFRRYCPSLLEARLKEAGFKVNKFINFNTAAIPAWWLNACVLKKAKMDRWQLKIFDMLVPIFRVLEYCLPLPGISIIAIAEKVSQPATPAQTDESTTRIEHAKLSASSTPTTPAESLTPVTPIELEESAKSIACKKTDELIEPKESATITKLVEPTIVTELTTPTTESAMPSESKLIEPKAAATESTAKDVDELPPSEMPTSDHTV